MKRTSAFLFLLVSACLPSCAGPDPAQVETIAYSYGVVDLCDAATALLTKDPERLRLTGLDKATPEEREMLLQDWRVMRERAKKILEAKGIIAAPIMPEDAAAIGLEDEDEEDEDEIE